ncbi:MAG: hypothetical protein IPJ01_10140 [Micavibrio sp.]|nr:hypothetical protein [Micavibrio sp.]
METTLDKIKTMVRTANSGSDILSPEMVEEVMPKVIEAINKEASKIGYDGFTYNRPQQEYPAMIYSLLWMNPIRETVLAYLEEKCPMAWFKPMYFTTDKQKEIGIIPDNQNEQAIGRMNRDSQNTKVVEIVDFEEITQENYSVKQRRLIYKNNKSYAHYKKTGEIIQSKKHKNKPVAKIKYHKGYFTVNDEVRKITDKKRFNGFNK